MMPLFSPEQFAIAVAARRPWPLGWTFALQRAPVSRTHGIACRLPRTTPALALVHSMQSSAVKNVVEPLSIVVIRYH